VTVTAQRELSDFEDASRGWLSVRDVPIRGGVPNDSDGFAIDSGLFGCPIFGPLRGNRSPGLVIGSCVGGSLGRIRLRLFVGLGLPSFAIPLSFRGLLPLALPLCCGALLFLGPSRCGAFRLSPRCLLSRLSYLVKDLAPIVVIAPAAGALILFIVLCKAAGRENRTHRKGGDKNGNAQE
jgi:hypothetical protein